MTKLRWTSKITICMVAMGFIFLGGPLYGEKIGLSFWSQYVTVKQRIAVTRIITGFQKENPNIYISHRILPNLESDEIVRIAFMGGEPPDISVHEAPYDTIKMFERGLILDLTDWYDQYGNRFSKAIDPSVKYKGRYYGVPLAGAMWIHIFYNADILEKYGIDVPQDYDEFLQACEVLKGQGIIPISLGNKGGPQGLHWYQALLCETVGAEKVNSIVVRKDPDKGPRWTDAGFLRAAEYFDELHEKGYFPSEAGTMSEQGMWMMFFGGKTGFMGCGHWFTMLDIPPDFNWGFFRFPHIPGELGYIPGELGYTRNEGTLHYLESLHISTTCAHPKAALKFLEYYTRPEVIRIFFEEAGILPATIGAVKPKELTEYHLALEKFKETATGTIPFAETVLPPAAGFGALYKGMQGISARAMTPLEFVENVEEVHQKELR